MEINIVSEGGDVQNSIMWPTDWPYPYLSPALKPYSLPIAFPKGGSGGEGRGPLNFTLPDV